MPLPRSHSEKRLFACFGGASWLEFHLRFNTGTKLNNPVKFEATQVWRSLSAPSLFAVSRGSFPSVGAAEASLLTELVASGGVVHPDTPQLRKQLATEFGYHRT